MGILNDFGGLIILSGANDLNIKIKHRIKATGIIKQKTTLIFLLITRKYFNKLVENMDTFNNESPYMPNDKLIISIMAGLLFILISSPVFYGITDMFFNTTNKNGKPTWIGILIHAIIFTLITWLLMK